MSLRDGFTLGDWTIYPLEGRLVGETSERRIQPKSMDVLLCLAENAGAVVERENILRQIWGQRALSDEPLTRCIGELRRALGDTRSEPAYIQTVPKRGYKLLQDVERLQGDAAETIEDESSDVAQGRDNQSDSITSSVGFKPSRLVIALTLLLFVVLLSDRFLSRQEEQESLTLRTSSSPAASAEKTLAVLPFRAMSDGSDDGYFADGLTEEIINSLTGLPELQVTARTSAFFFKGNDQPIPDIAKILGVAHIVDGSVRRDGERLRITAQLNRAADGFHLWSETYDRNVGDIFAVQIDIAENIATALDVVLDDGRRAQMRAAGVGDPQAFIAYQKGLELYALAHPNEEQLTLLAQANEFFEEAIERVPEFADAHHHHADYYTHILLDAAAGHQTDSISDEEIVAARAALQMDLEAAVEYARDDDRRLSAEIDRALLTGDWQGLSVSIDRLLDKSICTGSLWLQVAALPYDKTKDVRSFFRTQIDCDPLQFVGWAWDANALIWLGDFDEAIEVARAGLESLPQERLRSTIVKALIATGRHAEAETAIDRDLRTDVAKLSNQIMLAAARGDQNEARSYVATFSEDFATGSENVLQFHAWLGDRDLANELAADVDARPFGHMILAIAINNCYCGAPFDLEFTPGFADMLEEAGMPWPPKSPVEWPLKTW